MREVNEMGNKELAKMYRDKAREEIKKEKPNYTAFHYYLRQASFYQRLKPVKVPSNMVKTNKQEVEKEYKRV